MPRPRKSKALEKSGTAASGESGESRTLRALTELMAEISKRRTDIVRREAIVSDLQRKLTAELRPLEEKILELRLDTFRVLGAHLKSGRLNRRAHKALELALYDLANALEKEYGLDLREDRNRFFEEEFPEDPEAESPFEAGEDKFAGRDPYGEDAGAYDYRESDFTDRPEKGGGGREGQRERGMALNPGPGKSRNNGTNPSPGTSARFT